MDRRRFLRDSALAGAALAGASRLPALGGWPARVRADGRPPNILFVLVDQMRAPEWFGQADAAWARQPHLARLRDEAVVFGRHYTAANMCRPARSALLTGLYTHQTGILLTATLTGDPPALNPGFPTWGTLLRQLGYQTSWYGKWHLSEGDSLEPYGFAGGTYPSPNGGAGQGDRDDAAIADQFVAWFADHAGAGPWFTTVSFVNPHDIAWYYRATDRIPSEKDPVPTFDALPANFETPAQLIQQGKPRLQRALQEMAAVALGPLEFRGPNSAAGWLKMLDLYLTLCEHVDTQIGRVLDTLAANPAVAAETLVIFTADHGEYAGSHGLRGKGGAAYEEAIHVPLYIKDPTGRFVQSPEIERTQLTSSVDMSALLLSLAAGGEAWRQRPEYAHLARRLDMAALLRDAQAPGRPYVLHTTDEDVIEQSPQTPYATDAPSHVLALRSAAAKLGTYSFWAEGSLDIVADGQETELYDYATERGQSELDNVSTTQADLQRTLQRLLSDEALPQELREPLPSALQPYQDAAFAAYLAAHAGSPTPTPSNPAPTPTTGATPPSPKMRVHLPWAGSGR